LQEENWVAVEEKQLPRPGPVSRQFLDNVLSENTHLPLSKAGKVHLLLTVAPMPRLGQLYPVVFERILNEEISTNPVKVAGK
jgi:hypothetical protein